MQAKKYQVFVSSTYTDLIDERREVIEAIIDLGHIPAGMEGFPAIDMEQFRYIKKVIDQCDYYVLIVAGRYGSLSNDGISFTEMEYRYAVESGKIVIAFVIDPSIAAELPANKIESDPSINELLNNFKSEVMSGRLVKSWTDRTSLSRSVMKSLVAAFDEFPQEGWVRSSGVASEDILNQINSLRIENENLKEAKAALESQLKPRLNGLAELDASYTIQYEYTGDRGYIRSDNVTLSWRLMFVGVAPHLAIAKTPDTFIQILQSYLRDAGLVAERRPRINRVSGQQILVQLEAQGLIHRDNGKSTTGTMLEWVRRTDLGTRIMTESLIVTST